MSGQESYSIEYTLGDTCGYLPQTEYETVYTVFQVPDSPDLIAHVSSDGNSALLRTRMAADSTVWEVVRVLDTEDASVDIKPLWTDIPYDDLPVENTEMAPIANEYEREAEAFAGFLAEGANADRLYAMENGEIGWSYNEFHVDAFASKVADEFDETEEQADADDSITSQIMTAIREAGDTDDFWEFRIPR